MIRATVFRNWPSAAVLALLIAVPAGPLQAQEEERGRIELGIRHIFGNPNSSKFTEYRAIPKGLFIQRFELKLDNLLNDKYYFGYQARETLEKDQSHLVNAGSHGKYKLQLRWDQTPHHFTNMASTFITESQPGVFTVPAQIRRTLETTPASFSEMLQQARPINVSLMRETGGGTFALTPTSNWDFEVGYLREKQTGNRPIGTTTNSFTNVVELPEPIDYRTRQVKAGAEYAGRDWGIQAAYLASIFKNNVGEMVWDNPFRTVDTATASSRGRMDLYPDNSAHNLNVAGAVNVAKDTRFVGSVSRGWMRQDDAFLPFTINPAIAAVPALPALSLDGKKQTLTLNSTLTTDVIPSLSLTARYRSYDYANDTSSLSFANYARTDAGLNEGRRNLPYAYEQQTAGLDAVWRFDARSAVRIGYEWEQFDREYREVNRSTEHSFGGSVDLNPVSRVLLRASYRRSDRDPESYHANEDSYLVHSPTAMGQLEELRKFDQAARIRNRAEALAQFDITDGLMFSGSFGTTQDNYNDSHYGMRNSVDYNLTFDATYNLHPDIGVFGEYTRERYRFDIRSRQRSPASGNAPANDSTNNDWESSIRDVVDTWAAGFDGSAVSHKLTFEAFYSLSAGKGSMRARALGVPGSTGFLVTSAADYPDTSNRFHQLTTSIKLQCSPNFFPKVEYRFEKYGRIDFQIDRLRPDMSFLDPSVNTSLFLGANIPGYKAHILAVALEYRF